MSPFYQDSNGFSMVLDADSITQISDTTMMPFPISSSFSEGMSGMTRDEPLFGSPSIQSPQLRPRRRERTPEACMDSSPGEQADEDVDLAQPRKISRRRNSSMIPVPHYSNILSGQEQAISLSKDEYTLLQHGDYLVSRKQRNIFRSYSGNTSNIDSEEKEAPEERVRPSLRCR